MLPSNDKLQVKPLQINDTGRLLLQYDNKSMS